MNSHALLFISLSDREKAVILKQAREELGFDNSIIIEKDFWVCWTPDKLYKSELKDNPQFHSGAEPVFENTIIASNGNFLLI